MIKPIAVLVHNYLFSYKINSLIIKVTHRKAIKLLCNLSIDLLQILHFERFLY